MQCVVEITDPLTLVLEENVLLFPYFKGHLHNPLMSYKHDLIRLLILFKQKHHLALGSHLERW